MILEKLHSLKEINYKKFSQNLIATNLEILGVRMPNLKSLAKDIVKKGEALNFINSKKEEIYELVLLEGLVISYLNLDLKEKLKFYNNYIKKADNWALIDSVKIINSTKFKEGEKELLLEYIKVWLKSQNKPNSEFIVRAGLINLLKYFVNLESLDLIFSLKFEENKYYIMMAHAWLLAECMTKFPKQTLDFMKDNNLDKETHNKAISKMRDSFRVKKEDKEILLSLKKNY